MVAAIFGGSVYLNGAQLTIGLNTTYSGSVLAGSGGSGGNIGLAALAAKRASREQGRGWTRRSRSHARGR